jgi:hypothetical protein
MSFGEDMPVGHSKKCNTSIIILISAKPIQTASRALKTQKIMYFIRKNKLLRHKQKETTFLCISTVILQLPLYNRKIKYFSSCNFRYKWILKF